MQKNRVVIKDKEMRPIGETIRTCGHFYDNIPIPFWINSAIYKLVNDNSFQDYARVSIIIISLIILEYFRIFLMELMIYSMVSHKKFTQKLTKLKRKNDKQTYWHQ